MGRKERGGDPHEVLALDGVVMPKIFMVPGNPTPEDLDQLADLILDSWEDEEPAKKGGPGSGNFGHEGRPGERGGSAPSGSASSGSQESSSIRREDKHKITETPERIAKMENERDSFSSAYKSKVGDQSEITVDPSSVKNSAKTVKELHETAKEMAPVMKNVIDEAAKAAGGESYYGPGGKYLTKTMESLEEKVSVRGKELGTINDSVRGTVVVNDINNVPEALNTVRETLEKSGGRVLAIDDKFANPYDNGYVGVHVDAEFKTPSGSIIKGEIQIHGPEIAVKEASESIYKQVRSLKDEDPAKPAMMQWAKVETLKLFVPVLRGRI